MSATEDAKIVKQLEEWDWKILHALERDLPSKEWTPPEKMTKSTGLFKEEITHRLGHLEKAGLIMHSPHGYTLLNAGLDAIALNAFANKGLISALGGSIAVGKESDVYEAVTENGVSYALKFYRIGRTSFRDVKRKRGFLTEESQRRWLLVSIQAAKTEFQALKKLMNYGVSVPKVVARERHAVLMSKIEGGRLVDVHDLDDPKGVLRQILENVKNIYLKGGIVNSDLSEFNILFDGEKVWLIDWPQSVSKSHVNATMLLDRDILNTLRFFKRRYNLDYNLEAASFYVRGWRETPF